MEYSPVVSPSVAVSPVAFFFFFILGDFGLASGISPNISSVFPNSCSSVGPLLTFFFFFFTTFVFFVLVAGSAPESEGASTEAVEVVEKPAGTCGAASDTQTEKRNVSRAQEEAGEVFESLCGIWTRKCTIIFLLHSGKHVTQKNLQKMVLPTRIKKRFC